MKFSLLITFLLFFTFSCKSDDHKNHPYTFYYWKTKLSLNPSEEKALQKTKIPILYTRFFDVDKINGKFEPIATITKDQNFKTEKTIVPVVFITNQTFVGITSDEIMFLTKNILTLINKKIIEFDLKKSDEIQIDCDWTSGTQNDYFKFLKELQKISGKKITCTLRLHQVKDKAKTGIPPVEKVYLMCYSTSSPLEDSDKNSILDVVILENYLADIHKYPIRNIDVALPIYSWGIITNHLGKHKLINGLSSQDLKNENFQKTSENQATVMKDGFYFGYFLNKGFQIKIEEISDEQLNQVLMFLNKKMTNFNVIYYQLDEKFINHRSL